jgi:hypothetical protein
MLLGISLSLKILKRGIMGDYPVDYWGNRGLLANQQSLPFLRPLNYLSCYPFLSS